MVILTRNILSSYYDNRMIGVSMARTSRKEKIIVHAIFSIALIVFVLPRIFERPFENFESDNIIKAKQELEPLKNTVEDAIIHHKKDIFVDYQSIVQRSSILKEVSISENGSILFLFKIAHKEPSKNVIYQWQPTVQSDKIVWKLTSNNPSQSSNVLKLVEEKEQKKPH